MTTDEWTTCCLLIEQCFRGDFDENTQAAYRVVLGRFDAGEVAVAIQALVEAGQVFRPVPGEIVTRIRSTQSARVPSWAEVWVWLQKAMTSRRSDSQTLAWVGEECHPVVAAFASQVTLSYLRTEDFFCPDRGGILIHQLKVRWQEFVEVAEQRLLRGRALTAVGRGDGQPKTLDAAALIGGLVPLERPELESGEAA